MRRIDLLVIHCSASRPNQHLTFEMLDNMHRAKGCNGYGYHYYITRDGQLHMGRPEEMVGAHARHYNAHAIGICYEGGLDDRGRSADTRTAAQTLDPDVSAHSDNAPLLGLVTRMFLLHFNYII